MRGLETVGELEVAHAGLTGAHLALCLLRPPGARAVVADEGAVLQGCPVVRHQDRVGQAAVIRLRSRDHTQHSLAG